jgi:hypothetical protein
MVSCPSCTYQVPTNRGGGSKGADIGRGVVVVGVTGVAVDVEELDPQLGTRTSPAIRATLAVSERFCTY